MINVDSKKFVDSVENILKPYAPVLTKSIIKRQLIVIEADRDNLTHKQAKDFIMRVGGALRIFLGEDDLNKVKHMMMAEFRRYAPEYFQQ